MVYLIFFPLYFKGSVQKSDELHIYALSFALVPILSVILFRKVFLPWKDPEADDASFRTNFFLGLNGALVLLLAVSIVLGRFTRQLLVYWVVAQICSNLIGCLCFGLLSRCRPALDPIVGWLAMIIAILLSPAFLRLVLCGSTEDIVAQFSDKTVLFLGLRYSDYFKIGLGIFGAIILSSAFVYGRDRKKLGHYASRISLEIVGVVVAGTLIAAIATSPSPDVQTMNAHLGPAACVIGKGVPLVDVFCQYGMLSFLVFNALFCFIPASYTGAAFLVSFLNAVQFTVMLLLFRKTVSNRLLAYVTIAMMAVAWIAFGCNSIPAAGAMRFLPPLVLLLAIVYLPLTRLFSIFTLVSAAICSLWSFEGFAWGLMMYLSFIAAEYLMLREKWSGLILSVVQCLAAFIVPHVLYSLFVLAHSGVLPSYQLYFDMIFGYAGGRAGWTTPVDHTVLIWVLAPLSYIPVYGCSAWLIFYRQDRRRLDPVLFARVLLPVAILGGVELSYWVGRGYLAHIWGATLPFLIILACAVDRFAPPTWRIKTHLVGMSFILSVAVLYSASLAWGFRNSQLGILFNRDYLKASLAIALSNPRKEIHDPRITQAVELIQKWSPESREVLMLMPGSITPAALLYTGKGHRLHISNGQCDLSSILLSQRIVDRARDAVGEGELLYIQQDLRKQMYAGYSADNPAPDPDHTYTTLEIDAAFKLRERWRMSVVDRTSLGLLVLRLVPKEKWNSLSGQEYSLEPPASP